MTRYISAAPLRAYPVGSGKLLLSTPGLDVPRLAGQRDARLLAICRLPRTLDEHTIAAAAVEPGVDVSGVRGLLEEFVRVGLLREWTQQTLRSASLPISKLVVHTMDRPPLLERCLQSYLAHFREQSHRIDVLVFDDSRDDQKVLANRDVTSRAASVFASGVRYVGKEEKMRLVSELVAGGIDRRNAEFAIPIRPDGYAAGGNRNSGLLATAGHAVLSVDDDTVCTLWSTRPGLDGTVKFWGHADAHTYRFFASRDTARPDPHMLGGDLIKAHEALLGRDVCSLLTPGQVDRAMNHPCDHVLDAATGNLPGARVRLTFAGLAGDSAVDCPYRLLFEKGDSRHQMLSSQQTHRRALECREVRRVVECQVITHSAWCMTYCVGVDNTATLPPFLPTGYCEDGVFGRLLAQCDSQAFFGHVPCGIVHDSDRPSLYGRQFIRSASRIRLRDVLFGLMSRCHIPPSVTNPCDRLRHIGAYLTSVGRHPLAEFVELVRTVVLESRCEELMAIEAEVSADTPPPAYWVADLHAYRECVLSSVQSSRFFVPIEFSMYGNVDDAFRGVQAFIGHFGSLMSEWPDMVASARRLEVVPS